MRKPLKDPQHGESNSRRGSWSKAFRDFYADEAKAAGMPVDQFLDMVGDRLEKRGQRPKEFRRLLKKGIPAVFCKRRRSSEPAQFPFAPL